MVPGHPSVSWRDHQAAAAAGLVSRPSSFKVPPYLDDAFSDAPAGRSSAGPLGSHNHLHAASPLMPLPPSAQSSLTSLGHTPSVERSSAASSRKGYGARTASPSPMFGARGTPPGETPLASPLASPLHGFYQRAYDASPGLAGSSNGGGALGSGLAGGVAGSSAAAAASLGLRTASERRIQRLLSKIDSVCSNQSTSSNQSSGPGAGGSGHSSNMHERDRERDRSSRDRRVSAPLEDMHGVLARPPLGQQQGYTEGGGAPWPAPAEAAAGTPADSPLRRGDAAGSSPPAGGAGGGGGGMGAHRPASSGRVAGPVLADSPGGDAGYELTLRPDGAANGWERRAGTGSGGGAAGRAASEHSGGSGSEGGGAAVAPARVAIIARRGEGAALAVAVGAAAAAASPSLAGTSLESPGLLYATISRDSGELSDAVERELSARQLVRLNTDRSRGGTRLGTHAAPGLLASPSSLTLAPGMGYAAAAMLAALSPVGTAASGGAARRRRGDGGRRNASPGDGRSDGGGSSGGGGGGGGSGRSSAGSWGEAGGDAGDEGARVAKQLFLVSARTPSPSSDGSERDGTHRRGHAATNGQSPPPPRPGAARSFRRRHRPSQDPPLPRGSGGDSPPRSRSPGPRGSAGWPSPQPQQQHAPEARAHRHSQPQAHDLRAAQEGAPDGPSSRSPDMPTLRPAAPPPPPQPHRLSSPSLAHRRSSSPVSAWEVSASMPPALAPHPPPAPTPSTAAPQHGGGLHPSHHPPTHDGTSTSAQAGRAFAAAGLDEPYGAVEAREADAVRQRLAFGDGAPEALPPRPGPGAAPGVAAAAVAATASGPADAEPGRAAPAPRRRSTSPLAPEPAPRHRQHHGHSRAPALQASPSASSSGSEDPALEMTFGAGAPSAAASVSGGGGGAQQGRRPPRSDGGAPLLPDSTIMAYSTDLSARIDAHLHQQQQHPQQQHQQHWPTAAAAAQPGGPGGAAHAGASLPAATASSSSALANAATLVALINEDLRTGGYSARRRSGSYARQPPPPPSLPPHHAHAEHQHHQHHSQHQQQSYGSLTPDNDMPAAGRVAARSPLRRSRSPDRSARASDAPLPPHAPHASSSPYLQQHDAPPYHPAEHHAAAAHAAAQSGPPPDRSSPQDGAWRSGDRRHRRSRLTADSSGDSDATSGTDAHSSRGERSSPYAPLAYAGARLAEDGRRTSALHAGSPAPAAAGRGGGGGGAPAPVHLVLANVLGSEPRRHRRSSPTLSAAAAMAAAVAGPAGAAAATPANTPLPRLSRHLSGRGLGGAAPPVAALSPMAPRSPVVLSGLGGPAAAAAGDQSAAAAAAAAAAATQHASGLGGQVEWSSGGSMGGDGGLPVNIDVLKRDLERLLGR